MKTIKLFGAVVLLTFFLAACLDVDLKVKVKPDGSGTIEEQVLLSDDIVEMLSSFGEVDEEGNKESFNMYNEADLIAQAGDMGEGVKFIGGEKITIDGKQGYKAVFEFADINKIKVNQSPDSKFPEGTVDDEESDANGEFVTFNFIKGNPSSLFIILPSSKESDTKIEEETLENDSLNSSGMEDMFIEMMKDFRMNMEVDVEGEIVETDATYRDGSKITLLLMDFKKLFEMPEKLKEFKKFKPSSYKQAGEFFREIPGFKFEFNEKVEVKIK